MICSLGGGVGGVGGGPSARHACLVPPAQCASFVSSGNCKLATKEPQRAKDLNAM